MYEVQVCKPSKCIYVCVYECSIWNVRNTIESTRRPEARWAIGRWAISFSILYNIVISLGWIYNRVYTKGIATFRSNDL